MTENPNITVEASSQSLPHREVHLIVKFTNHDDKDYYCLVDHVGGYSFLRGISINNTIVTKNYDDAPWQNCPAWSTVPGYTYQAGFKYVHIPANGTCEVKLNIIAVCEFLQHEHTKDNTDGYWFKYEHRGNIEVMSEQYPSYDAQYVVGTISLPKIELHFDLID